jgi:acyl-CoA-binding protein
MTEKSLDIRFQEAIELAEKIPQASLPQDVQLRCYAYFKQATLGSVDSKRTSNFDLRNAFKTNAWMQISHISADEAKEKYIEAITEIHKNYKP